MFPLIVVVLVTAVVLVRVVKASLHRPTIRIRERQPNQPQRPVRAR
jgi:hypothetical protein